MNIIEELISQLIEYDNAYHNGDSVIPDVQYDQLKREIQKQAPNHPYFIQVGSDVRGGKVKLPYSMGSLNQIYENDYEKWCNKFNLKNESIVVSHKLDGVSCMIQYKDGKFRIAYSRGNGVMGADITRHVSKIINLPKDISLRGHVTIRGELIMKNDTFERNWKDEFANPRNMTSGIFNRSITDEDAIKDIDFIAYQIVDGSDEFKKSSQVDDMQLLDTLGFTTVTLETVRGSKLDDDELTSMLTKARQISPYELDGIVLTINEKNAQKNLSNSSSLNPEHSVKYKVLDKNSIVEAEVVNVSYEISKHGLFKPRVEIIPVQLFGTTVTFATGFNGRYINDNNIGPGTIVNITKSGSVIPHILNVVKPTNAQLPIKELWEWNENGVDMVINNYQNNPTVIFKQVLDFFNTLEVDLLKEASIKKIIDYCDMNDEPYETILAVMIDLTELEWEKAIGANGSKIYASLERKLNTLTLARYLGAVKYFGSGFGVRKAKLLLKNLTDESSVWNLTVPKIIEFEGFDTITAEKFVDGLREALELSKELDLKFKQEVKTNELQHLVVVFTGFRDKEFQDKLEKTGAKVGTSVSKKTTHVITAEPNSMSGKAVKARELGIKTLSLDEFKEEFNL